MPTYFCQKCATGIAYETTKPQSCPKCKKVFTDTSKVVAKMIATPIQLPTPSVRAKEVVEDDDDTPIVPRRKIPSILGKKRAVSKAVYHDEEGNLEDIPAPDDEDEDEDFDPRAVRRRARELAASVEIKLIANEEEKTRFSFKDWCGAPPTE